MTYHCPVCSQKISPLAMIATLLYFNSKHSSAGGGSSRLITALAASQCLFWAVELAWTLYFFLLHPEYPWWFGYTRPLDSLPLDIAAAVRRGEVDNSLVRQAHGQAMEVAG